MVQGGRLGWMRLFARWRMLVNKGSGEQYILRFANAVLMRMCRVDENRSHRQGGCIFFQG